jgi:hypothetical protein
MRKLQIAAIAFFAFGSAGYAMGGQPYHPAPTQPDANSAATEFGAAPYGGYSANMGMTSQPQMGWGPGDAWRNFPGSLNANGS